MTTPLARGFTLIELLVVIAIIGLLSSIVLASLSTARANGRFSAVLLQMRELQSSAELSTGAYVSPCGIYPCDVVGGVMPPAFKISSWPVPACPGWTFDWENWYSGAMIRLTLRHGSAGASIAYLCITDTSGVGTGNCSNGGSDGIDILTYSPRQFTCNE